MGRPQITPNKSDALLARVAALHPKSIDLTLDRMWRLLARLDHPERRLPPVIHVSGTNGKGSLVAYLTAMLEAAGYAVHAYTSPHLVHFSERIRLARADGGGPIAEAHLAAVLEECERLNGEAPITFFEITTAAALLAFTQTPADVLLLETGLGGRLDATNVVARPALTAVTPISHDHQQFLGSELADIAGEKAGILKPGVPAVIAPQPAEAAEVIAARATALGAPLFRHGGDWRVRLDGDEILWEDGKDELRLPTPGLAGTHQIDNAGTAVACARRLSGFTVDMQAIAEGLRRVEWPGRLQRLVAGPLADMAPPRAELWLDGGHNPAAGEALAASLESGLLGNGRRRPLYLVVGMLNSKDPEAFLTPLAPLVERAWGVAIPDESASLPAADVAAAACRVGIACRSAPSLEAAFGEITEAASGEPPVRILVCGSLYLAGKVLAGNR